FAVRPRLRVGTVLSGIAVTGVVLLMGIWWSAIKNDYRALLDQGTGQQVVLVSFENRIEFLLNKLVEFDGEMFDDGFKRLVRRMGYIDFLAATMSNVPTNLPFQEGRQIGDTIINVLQPRLLFPDKPPLPSDTEVLQKYTGFYFGGSTSIGTSV